MSKIKEYVRHLAVVAMATLVAQCAWAEVTPKLLINFAFNATPEVTGWHRHYQNGGGKLGGDGITENGITFSTTSGGNFYERAKVSGDYQTGTYVGIDGTTEYTSVTGEIAGSLGFGESIAFTDDVWKTGLMNGGVSGHTATISGLSATKKYVVYLGYGLYKSDGPTQQPGFELISGGYSSFESVQYVKNTDSSYQNYTSGQIKPDGSGLMVVRVKALVPTASGEFKFKLVGDRAGLNFLAVGEMDESIPTADLTASGVTSWTTVVNGADLTDKAVTLKLGGDTTITLDAAKPSMASFSVALADGVEAATLKFVAKSALWMPGAVGEGVTFTGLEINAETVESIRTADLTIAANETVLVNGTTLGKITNNGTLNVTGDSTFKLANNGTVNLLSGTSTISADSQAIKGTINIAYGATYKCANNDQVPYGGSTTTTINVRGTLDMQNHRWTLGGADTINLYGGCTVSGQGDNDGLFDLYRDGNIINVQAGEGDQAEVKVVTLPAPIRARHTNGNIFIAQGMKLALTGGIKKADNDTSVVNMNGNGRLTGTVALKGGFTLNLGNAVGTIDAKFVAEGGTTALKLGEGAASTQITTSDSKDDPIVLVKSGATLDLYVKDFSSWNQSVTQYGWVKNEGTLNIYEYATNQSRYFRGHLVMQPGTTTTLYGTSQNFIVYGGNSDVAKAQMIVPASETATTTTFAGEGTIQLNVNGSGGTPGSAWDIGANSTLDVTAKVIGGEAIAKYGEGTLKFSNAGNDYTGTITLKAGTIVVPDKLGDDKVVTDVAGMAVVFDEATLTYSLIPAEIAFTVTGLPEHAVAYIQINNGETTPIEGGTFTAMPGDQFVVWFTPAEGYVGKTLSTGVVTVVYPMQTTEIQSPTAELMNIRPVVAIAAVGEPSMQPDVHGFGSLAEAIAAGWYVFLTDAVTVDSTIVIDHSVVIDLQGHNVTGNGVRVFQVKNGTVEIDSTDADSGDVVPATISTTGEINPDSSVIRIGGGDASAAPELTIDEGVTISSAICYGITAFGVGTQTLVVDGTVSTTGNRPAISGNGNASNGETTITINGTVSATAENAIYQPQAGTTTINGTVTGGIEAKAGAVTIKTGATVSARETTETHTANGDGCSTQGYAVAVVDNAGYKGGAVVTIEGGTITGPVAQVVDSEAKEANTLTITGGTFTVDPSAYIADGYEATESEGVWTVSEKTGPTSWDDIKENDDVTTIITLPEGQTETAITATELKAWAEKTGATFGEAIPVNALIFNVTPAAAPTAETEAAAASKVLEEVIEAEKLDLAALLEKAVNAGADGLTITSLAEEYPMATIKLVPSTKLDSTETAKFFQLSIELK